jgi:hypothetical protein
MPSLSPDERQALESGEPVRLRVDGREVVALRADVYERIQETLAAENALIAAGATRGPVEPTVPLLPEPERPSVMGSNGDVVFLDARRYREICELAEDARLRAAVQETSRRALASRLRDEA